MDIAEDVATETPSEPTEMEAPSTEETESEPSEELEAGAPKEPEPPSRDAFERASFKVKIDGEEQEISGKKLVEAYQRGESAAARFREAAELRKLVDEKESQLREVARELQTPEGFYDLLLSMKTDPIEFLSRVASLAKKEAELTPEQRELRELREKLAREDAAKQKVTKQQETEAQQAQITELREAYEDAFEDEMDVLGIPEDDDIRDDLLRMLGPMGIQAMEEGDDPEVYELVEKAWNKYRSKYEKVATKVPTKALAPTKNPIPGTKSAAKTESAKPKTSQRSGVRTYQSGSSFEDLLKLAD